MFGVPASSSPPPPYKSSVTTCSLSHIFLRKTPVSNIYTIPLFSTYFLWFPSLLQGRWLGCQTRDRETENLFVTVSSPMYLSCWFFNLPRIVVVYKELPNFRNRIALLNIPGYIQVLLIVLFHGLKVYLFVLYRAFWQRSFYPAIRLPSPTIIQRWVWQVLWGQWVLGAV